MFEIEQKGWMGRGEGRPRGTNDEGRSPCRIARVDASVIVFFRQQDHTAVDLHQFHAYCFLTHLSLLINMYKLFLCSPPLTFPASLGTIHYKIMTASFTAYYKKGKARCDDFHLTFMFIFIILSLLFNRITLY